MEFLSNTSPKDIQNNSNLNMTTIQTFFDSVFNAMDDSVFLCDSEDHIVLMNSSALQLFHMFANTSYRGMTSLDIFHQYEWHDEENQPLPFDQFPPTVLRTRNPQQRQVCRIVLLSELQEQRAFQLCCSFVFDSQKNVSGMLCVFHETTAQQQKEKQKDLLSQAITALVRAVIDIPNLLNTIQEKEPLQLPTSIGSVGQNLVDIICPLLACESVILLAIGSKKQTYYAAISGFTGEQRLRRLEVSGHFSLDDIFDSVAVTRLSHNDVVIMTYDQIALPFEEANPHTVILVTPILLENHLAGVFICRRNGLSRHYTEEEIFLTRSIADFLACLLITMHALFLVDKVHASALIRTEANILIDSFLTSASHELRTPLTVVVGNIQLARRRLQTLIQQLLAETDGQFAAVTMRMEKIQQLLAYVSQGAITLDTLLDTIIADVQIHQEKFVLKINRFNLHELLLNVVEQQRRQHLNVNIQLRVAPSVPPLFLLADQRRIEQVVTIYIMNAIADTPPDKPVFVQAEQSDETVRIAVSDEGPAIPLEQQKDVWERFSRPRTNMPVHDSEWNLGLGLSFCKEIIQQHQGQVGFKSDRESGTTFWFTLPITKGDQE